VRVRKGEPVGGSERARVRVRKGEPVGGSGHLLSARSGVLPSRAALGSCLAAAGRPSPPRLARQAPRSRLRLAHARGVSMPQRVRDPDLPGASLHGPPGTIRAVPVGHGGRRRRTRRAPSGDCGAGRVAVAGRDPRDHEGRRARGSGKPVGGSGGTLGLGKASLSADRATCFPRDRASCPHARRSAPASLPQVGPHRRGSPARHRARDCGSPTLVVCPCRSVFVIPTCRVLRSTARRERSAPCPWAMAVAGGAQDVRRPATAERDA
jgi:hypothetical protein